MKKNTLLYNFNTGQHESAPVEHAYVSSTHLLHLLMLTWHIKMLYLSFQVHQIDLLSPLRQ